MEKKIFAVLGLWFVVLLGSLMIVPVHAEQTAADMGLEGFSFPKAEPGEIADISDGTRFGCQRGDFGNDIYCHIVARQGDYLIYSNAGGVACPDNEYGVVNLKTNKGTMIPADGQKCNGQLKAGFLKEKGVLYAVTFLPKAKTAAGHVALDF